MATPRIELWGNGALQYTYLFNGLLKIGDRLRQSNLSVPKPFGSYEKRILANFFGQQRSLRINFVIYPRSDDYTDGTASYSTGSAKEQKNYLMETMFFNQGTHKIIDSDGEPYTGRISNMKIDEAGDQPITFEGDIDFDCGDVHLDFFKEEDESSS